MEGAWKQVMFQVKCIDSYFVSEWEYLWRECALVYVSSTHVLLNSLFEWNTLDMVEKEGLYGFTAT